MKQNLHDNTTTMKTEHASKQALPAVVPVPEVAPLDRLGDVLLSIQSDARSAPKNFLSGLRAPYGGE